MLIRERQLELAFLLAGGVLWLLSHPYAGIYQDANLYSLMAINWLDSRPFAQDPWFLFGSQDAFSLFSPLYGTLIRLLGLSEAAKMLVILGGLFWLGAAWAAVQRLFSDPVPVGVAFLSCAVFSLNISPLGNTFVLNENFATARLLAMPLGIVAVAWGTGGRLLLPVLLAAGATVLHPLYGIWALLLLIALRIRDRVLGTAILAGAAALVLLAYAPSLPFLTSVSPERIAFLQASTRDLLVPAGDLSHLNSLFFWLGALMLGARYGRADFRRVYLLVALLAALGYLLSAIVSIYWPVEFFLMVQPWRAVWLAAFFAVLALVDVGWVLAGSFSLGRHYVALAAFVLLLCKPFAGFVLIAAWAIGGHPAVIGAVAWFPRLSLPAVRILVAVAVLAALPGFVADVRLEGEVLVLFGWTREDFLRGIVGGGGYGLGPLMLTALILLLASRKPWLPLVLLLPAVAWGAANWDTRGAWQRRWEESLRTPAPALFEGFRQGQTVYWPGALPRVWFELGTAGYIGVYHQSGLVFSQARSELVVARWRRAAVASVAETTIRNSGDEDRALDAFRRKHPERDFRHVQVGSYAVDSVTAAGVEFLCLDSALDWVIADSPRVAGVDGTKFGLPSEPRGVHYAHSCQQLRDGSVGDKEMTEKKASHHG